MESGDKSTGDCTGRDIGWWSTEREKCTTLHLTHFESQIVGAVGLELFAVVERGGRNKRSYIKMIVYAYVNER